jgi:leucyl-tRNA synthetase
MTRTDDDTPKYRYTAALANEIEAKWQDRWEAEHTFWAPNPSGPLSEGFDKVATREKLYVLDMFPYPSGAGLHVGQPLGYIGTDVYARFKRMTGFNVLHAMGYDAFGLPAEQYAVQTGQHPRITTEANIANMKGQLRALGLGHDPRRGVATTDVSYYRWTQWIFLQIFNSWYDEEQDRARPIAELIPRLQQRPEWAELDAVGRRGLIDEHRLAYLAEVPVNWCPALGTVLANEEVTADGRSERGNHPVYKRPLKQWMLRITAYAERLLADLDLVEWSDSVKLMQRNWIGRSEGASVLFPVEGHDGLAIEVFTTRPDTLFGATYMVLAPEHPLVDEVVAAAWPGGTPVSWRGALGTDGSPPEAVAAYRRVAESRTDVERQAEGDAREKTGVFVGAFATNPTSGTSIPIFVADYVLMGYGTGAIMAVPGQDQRDWDFAEEFDLPIIRTVRPPEGFDGQAYLGDGPAMNSGMLDGLDVAAAKRTIIDWLDAEGKGRGTVNYKLRDWLFSRQRYWGEPFPIVYDATGLPVALPESMLPVELPEIIDFEPRIVEHDEESLPDPPLARAEHWVTVELDLDGRGQKTYLRELNTMPQWAGSCWYYLRYLDPTDENELVGPEAERYWMHDECGSAGGVDLYVGGVEHAVLHLLYARFWHKVLDDLGHVSTPEPFQRLFNQGMILAAAYTDDRGVYVEAAEVVEEGGRFLHHGEPVTREYGKMGKSLKNGIAPDDICAGYGADTLRLYEMFMGPLDASRPWNTADIVGVHRFLQRLWRNVVDEETGEPRLTTEPADDATRRLLHRTIAAVRADMAELGFNTAIARLFELNNRLHQVVAEHGEAPEEIVEPLVLMAAPLAPHVAEELWERLGHGESLAYEDFPEANPALLVDAELEIPVQVDGKLRARVTVPADADDAVTEAAARADARIAALLDGKTVRKVVVVRGRLVNFVTV